MYEIYSVGDGLFMQKVMMAISMMYGHGTFASLGRLGLLLGILLVALKAVGGKVEIQQIFVGILLFSVMFSQGATVHIVEVGYSPGQTVSHDYVVDDVPIGVAIMGSVISTVAHNISIRMEQAFQPTANPESLLSVGFGRSLDWLTAVRFAGATGSSGNTRFERYRTNTVHFLMNCSSRGFIANPDRAATAMLSADPMDTNTAFGFNAPGVTTKWLDPVGGSPSERSCEFAYNNLQNYYNGAGFFSDWAKSVAGRNGQLGSSPPANAAAYGFAAVGLSLTDAQSYVKANIINRAWAAAIPNIPYVGGEQARQFAMIASAAEQSATQHAGEETMFRRLMRPMMAFFECMVYAAAPFMALVAGFGMVGFRLLGKYALVTLWVALWIPVLAIINQFQLTMAERAITLVTNTPSGGTVLPIGSLTGANAVHNAAIDWINTGSMLAASTPAITLMLLFGSAMTAVGLAQALKGGDHLNEKTVSPDAAKPAAVEDGRAMLSTGYAGGTSVAGAPIPTMSFGSAVQTSAASTQSASENALLQYGKTGAVQAARASAIDTATGMAANKNQNLTLSQNETDVFNSVMGNDTSFNATSSAAKRLAISIAAGFGGSGSLAIGGGGDGKAGGLMGIASALFKGKGPSASISGDVTRTGTSGDDFSQALTMADKFAAAASDSKSVQAQLAAASADGFTANSSVAGSESNKLSHTAGVTQAATDASQRGKEYREASQLTNQSGHTQSIPQDVAAQKFNQAGLTGAAVKAAQQYGSPAAYASAMHQLQAGNYLSPDLMPAAAAQMVLSDQVPGFTQDPAGRVDRARALTGMLVQSGLLQVGTTPTNAGANGADATANRGLAADVAPGAAKAAWAANGGQIPEIGTMQSDIAATRAALENPAMQPAIHGGLGSKIGADAARVLRAANTAEASNADRQTPNGGSFDRIAGDLAKDHAKNAETVTARSQVPLTNAANTQAENNTAGKLHDSHALSTNGGYALNALLGVSDMRGRHSMPISSAPREEGFAALVDSFASGQMTGFSMPNDQAQVMAAMHAYNNGGAALGRDDYMDARNAYYAMSGEQQAAMRRIDKAWDQGDVMPHSPTSAYLAGAPRSAFEAAGVPSKLHESPRPVEERAPPNLRVIGGGHGVDTIGDVNPEGLAEYNATHGIDHRPDVPKVRFLTPFENEGAIPDQAGPAEASTKIYTPPIE